jgi:hypothetical protein
MQVPAGPAEGTLEHRELEAGVGFGYCQVLGELVYAYVVCELDIGFAITLLLKFTSAPAREHYLALKNIVRYLCRTKDWGIVYWHESPVESLLKIDLVQPESDLSLPASPRHALL